MVGHVPRFDSPGERKVALGLSHPCVPKHVNLDGGAQRIALRVLLLTAFMEGGESSSAGSSATSAFGEEETFSFRSMQRFVTGVGRPPVIALNRGGTSECGLERPPGFSTGENLRNISGCYIPCERKETCWGQKVSGRGGLP